MGYTDLSTSFAYKQILPWVRMDALAENDYYDHFPSGTRAFFYSATVPTGWTKITGQNDKALRIVTGSGGGTGGSTAFSSTVTLAHTHTTTNHSHTGNTHRHDMDVDTTISGAAPAGWVEIEDLTNNRLLMVTGSGIGSVSPLYAKDRTGNTSPSTSSDSAGSTNSQLSNIQFAYADVIIGEKQA